MGFGHDGKTVYFCVDLEASGPVPGLFNMVSVAGVEVRWDGQRHVRGDSFYYEMQPIFPGFDPQAMAIHRLTEQYLRENGLHPRDVLNRIADWVNDHLAPKERALFVGHNAPFDWMFVAWYFAWAGLTNPFGYNALDTKALFMGKHGVHWRETNKERIQTVYPHLQAPAPEEVHNALVDAVFQADILIALLDH